MDHKIHKETRDIDRGKAEERKGLNYMSWVLRKKEEPVELSGNEEQTRVWEKWKKKKINNNFRLLTIRVCTNQFTLTSINYVFSDLNDPISYIVGLMD